MQSFKLIKSGTTRAVFKSRLDEPNIDLNRVDQISNVIGTLAFQAVITNEHIGMFAYKVHLV